MVMNGAQNSNKTLTPIDSASKRELDLKQLQVVNGVIDQHAIVSITDVAGRITYVNDKFCEISGYSRDELLGQNHRIVKSDKNSQAFYVDMWRTISQGRIWQGLIENQSKNGRSYWVQTTITPVCDDGGKPQQYISIRTDVSAHTLAQRELQKFRYTLDKTLDCVFIFNATSLRFTYVNRGATEQVGYEREELLRMSPVDITPFDQACFQQMLAPLINGEQRLHTFETVHAHKSGRLIPVEITCATFPSDSSEGQFFAVVRDITEQKRMVEALESLSVAKLGENVFVDIAQSISESLASRWVGIDRIGDDNNTAEVVGFWDNGKPGELFTYPLAGTPSADVCDRVHTLCVEDRVSERYPEADMLTEMGAVSYRGELLLDQLGERVGVLWVIDDKPCLDLVAERTLLRVAAKRVVLEMQRMDSNRLLAERNKQLSDTLERISDGFFSLDQNWHFTFVNSFASLIFDTSLEKLKGQCIWNVLPEAASFFDAPLQQAMESQNSIHIVDFYSAQNTWLEIHAYPSSIGISVYLKDISEKKKLEQEQRELTHRTQRAQKMEAVGRLTAGIAHDFNNILASIKGYTGLALSRFVREDQAKLRSYLQNVQSASNRGRDLVLQMLNFSREGSDEDEVTAIHPEIPLRETVKMLQSTLPASIDMTLGISSEAVAEIAIPALQLQQLVMQLCVNARDALRGKGRIRIHLATNSGDHISCDSCHVKTAGEFVELLITDCGEGIESSEMEKLFEPFYTTKEVGQGTGLGLSEVHGIVHKYGGHITVESSPKFGSAFHLFFPAVAQTSQTELVDTHCEPSQHIGRGETILVVDDEPDLLGLVEDLLADKGFKVECYSDSQRALSDFQKNPQRFDLLITDLTMPGLTGTELLHEVHLLRQDLPVILCSGYRGSLQVEKMPKYELNRFLHKPYEINTLLMVVDELLNLADNETR